MALPLIATIHAARLEARFIKAMAEGRAWVTAEARLPDVEPEADPIATPHKDRLRAEIASLKVDLQHQCEANHRNWNYREGLEKERDDLKAILLRVAPLEHRRWLEARIVAKARSIIQEDRAIPTATPHITTRADIEEVDRLRADLKAVKGTAAVAQRKVLAQAKELEGLTKIHTETRENLSRTTRERDLAKAILRHVGYYDAYLAMIRAVPGRNTDIPQTHETQGD